MYSQGESSCSNQEEVLGGEVPSYQAAKQPMSCPQTHSGLSGRLQPVQAASMRGSSMVRTQQVNQLPHSASLKAELIHAARTFGSIASKHCNFTAADMVMCTHNPACI